MSRLPPGYRQSGDVGGRIAYILVHQAGLANTAVSEDDHLYGGLVRSSGSIIISAQQITAPYLQEDLLSRRHAGWSVAQGGRMMRMVSMTFESLRALHQKDGWFEASMPNDRNHQPDAREKERGRERGNKEQMYTAECRVRVGIGGWVAFCCAVTAETDAQ